MAKIKFKLKHKEGVTLFMILEQEGIKRGCGEIFKGDNGWSILSAGGITLEVTTKDIFIRGNVEECDLDIELEKDPNKEIYNNVLKTFKQLGNSQTDKFEPKEGDKVLVRNSADYDWKERIFIHSLNSKASCPYITVRFSYDEEYIKGDNYCVSYWEYMKPLYEKESSFKQLDEETFEVTFEMDENMKGIKKG